MEFRLSAHVSIATIQGIVASNSSLMPTCMIAPPPACHLRSSMPCRVQALRWSVHLWPSIQQPEGQEVPGAGRHALLHLQEHFWRHFCVSAHRCSRRVRDLVHRSERPLDKPQLQRGSAVPAGRPDNQPGLTGSCQLVSHHSVDLSTGGQTNMSYWAWQATSQ